MGKRRIPDFDGAELLCGKRNRHQQYALRVREGASGLLLHAGERLPDFLRRRGIDVRNLGLCGF